MSEEADVLRDTLKAVRWYTFKGPVSLPKLIWMDAEDDMTTLKKLQLFDGLGEEENITSWNHFVIKFLTPKSDHRTTGTSFSLFICISPEVCDSNPGKQTRVAWVFVR